MPIQSVERTAAPDDILATLERDGVVIIRELIDRTTMQGLMGKIEPRLAERKTGGGKFFGYRKRSIGALFSHGPELSQLPLNGRTITRRHGSRSELQHLPAPCHRGDTGLG